MKNKKQINILDETRSPIMTILLLAWPVFVEQIFTTLVSFADTAMVGSLGQRLRQRSALVIRRCFC